MDSPDRAGYRVPVLTKHVTHVALLCPLIIACPGEGGDTDSDPTTGPGTGSASSTSEPSGTTNQPTTGTSSTTTTGTSGDNTVSGGTSGDNTVSSGDTSGDASTGSSTTTGTPAGPYGPCSRPEDCEPTLHCVQLYNYCSPNCRESPDCPLPASGDAAPNCTDSSGGSYCRLPCSGSTICPDDMTCIQVQPGPPASCGYR